MNDDNNNFEEEKRIIDERLGILHMPTDTKGRVITIVVLVLVLITIWFMLDVAIVTFILTFVFYHLHKVTMQGLAKTPFQVIPGGIVLLLLYAGVIALFVLFAVHNTPLIVKQLSDIASSFARFDFKKLIEGIDPNLMWVANQVDINAYIGGVGQAIMGGLASFGTVALNFFLALFLSFLFVLERKKIAAVGDTIRNSRVAFIYRYFLLFGGSFCHTFAKVMKVQVVIATINCAISMVYLSIAGFPYIMVLGIMIFVLGLIPVAGVFISLVPLTIIAFNVGGILKIVEVLIMIAIIHAIEAYFLNPKLMSRRTALPVSLIFVVLIISERYLGAWGMLIGVPIFIYVLNVLNIDYQRAMRAEFLKEGVVNADPGGETPKGDWRGSVFGGLFKRKKREDDSDAKRN